MSDDITIEPALSAEQWSDVIHENEAIVPDAVLPLLVGRAHSVFESIDGSEGLSLLQEDRWIMVRSAGALRAMIAIANQSLPAADPRKITQAHVELLRDSAKDIIGAAAEDLCRFADALESYLPPE